MSYLDSLDIANRAAQILGVKRIKSVTEDSRQNIELATAYDKLLDAELQRNTWTFATRKTALRALTATTLLVQPNTWNAAQLYTPGSVVADTNGDLWVSATPENVGNSPGSSDDWDQYFGPMTADVWATGNSYFAGELVYYPVGNPGSFIVFMSLVNDNSDEPDVADAWSAATTYTTGDTVTNGGSVWRSLIPLNLNITPADAPLAFSASTTYAINTTALGSDGYVYQSLANGNVGHDPVLDGGVHWTNTLVPAAWTRTPATYASATSWVPIFAGLAPVRVLSPIANGPYSTAGFTKNMYHLPANYLMRAPQNPKQGVVTPLGGPSGYSYNDWEYDGDYIITSQSNVIVFRFVASITQVTKMSDLFCSALGAHMAMETSEILTQSDAKFQKAGLQYKLDINDARVRNAIEQGLEEIAEDEFIAVRF